MPASQASCFLPCKVGVTSNRGVLKEVWVHGSDYSHHQDTEAQEAWDHSSSISSPVPPFLLLQHSCLSATLTRITHDPPLLLFFVLYVPWMEIMYVWVSVCLDGF